MSTDTEVAFSQSFQQAQGYASHAARRLALGYHEYEKAHVYVFRDGREHITLESAISTFEPPYTYPVNRPNVRGWDLETDRFFLSRRGRLMMVWEDRYATVVNVRTFSTAYMLLDTDDMEKVASELKVLART